MELIIGNKKNNHWRLQDNRIEIYVCQDGGLFKMPKQTKSILLKDIECIEIYWKNVLMGHIWKYAHPLYMKIKLKNDEIYSIELNTDHSNNILIQALDILQDANIEIIDTYNILNAVKDPNINTWEYIEKIIKENNLEYK